MSRPKRKPYKIVGAYDTETTNINDVTGIYAFPVCYQLGILSCAIEDVTKDNIRANCDISIFRQAADLYHSLDDLAQPKTYVPVIVCHNLAFDMYSLAPFFQDRDVKVLAKSKRKPITFTLLDGLGNPALVFWDTLVFSQQSLERMGNDCGYEKAVGNWDYTLIRTPKTPLTDAETIYAKDDIFALLCWVSWWISRNPEIDSSKLGLNVVTKTGIVRELRKVRFQDLKCGKYNLGKQWLYMNRMNAPKSDDELFTMQASTRGGFTFCASSSASIPYDFENSEFTVAAYDAVSMHPAQMVSHRYPIRFHETSAEALMLLFDKLGTITPDMVMRRWSKPFIKAVYACFTFTHLRPRKDSIFEQWGIFPLASARFTDNSNVEMDDDNGDALTQDDMRRERGFADTCINPVFAFGKLVSADSCTIYCTELTLWEIWQCYEWDNVQADHGYMSGRFVRVTDLSVISVMQFYQAKNEFKQARASYYRSNTIENGEALLKLGIPESIVRDMENGSLSNNDVEATYLSLKANLNSLFGIEATNEYRRDTVMTPIGIDYTGNIGICNAPKNNKAWYQFGQRIVGWSRITQICAMHLIAPFVESIICGDTDSLKFACRRDNLRKIDDALKALGKSIDKGKQDNCSRVKRAYPEFFDDLENIGHYEREYTTDKFCAAWNKAYCEKDESGFSFTLAGIPSRDVYKKDDAGELKLYEKRVNGLADSLHESGMSFSDICNLLLGYNVTYSPDLTGLNARKFPVWGDLVNKYVVDYTGNACNVVAPSVLALYPMAKTIGSTANKENKANAAIALENNASVNMERVIITKRGIVKNA